MTDESAVSGEELFKNRRGGDKDELTVEISYKGVKKKFSGNVEAVWLSLNRFFNEFQPSFEIAQKLNMNIDLQNLVKDAEGIIGFTKEGHCLLVPRNKLTDNETLSLILLARYLAYRLGKAETDEVSKEELRNNLCKDAKITSTRVAELVKNHVAAKTSEEKYKITTFGLTQLQKHVIPSVRAKKNSE